MDERPCSAIFVTLFLIIFLPIAYGCYEDPTTCDERVFDRDSFVCVCDAEYCDVFGDTRLPSSGYYKRVISSRDKHRFTIQTEALNYTPEGNAFINIDYETKYQAILGFGGAFSDSTGITVASLSERAQDKLMRSYFSDEGLEYLLCRIPIAGTDFSTHPYSYDEVDNDIHLEYFTLTKEDLLYKIPFIKKAKNLTNHKLRLFASPWSPPSWMKENKKLNGKGGLLKEMWDPFSQYIIRFIEEYEKHNISLWGITTTNEPQAGFQDWRWNACAWSPEDMRDWIIESFGPALEKAALTHLKVMVSDQSRAHLPSYPATILNDKRASEYVAGVAVHWYDDSVVDPEVLDEFQRKFLDKFLLYTEACNGFDSAPEDKVQLGSWQRAQNYSSNIIEALNHFSVGWVDWNMALDTSGGPTWANNNVDAPILINESQDEFYKQPMFYAVGHFSKFVVPGSKRLRIEGIDQSADLQATAFITPDGHFVCVILNRGEEETKTSIQTPDGKYMNFKMNPKSLETILFNKK